MKDILISGIHLPSSSHNQNSSLKIVNAEISKKSALSSSSISGADTQKMNQKFPPPIPPKKIPSDRLSQLISSTSPSPSVSAFPSSSSSSSNTTPSNDIPQRSSSSGGAIPARSSRIEAQLHKFQKLESESAFVSAAQQKRHTIQTDRPVPPPRKDSKSRSVLAISKTSTNGSFIDRDGGAVGAGAYDIHDKRSSVKVSSIVSDFEQCRFAVPAIPLTPKPNIATTTTNNSPSNKEFAEHLAKKLGTTTTERYLPLRSSTASDISISTSSTSQSLRNSTANILDGLLKLKKEQQLLNKSNSSLTHTDSADESNSPTPHLPSSSQSLSINSAKSKSTTPRTFSPFSKKQRKKTESMRSLNISPTIAKPRWFEGVVDTEDREKMLSSMSKDEKIRQEVSFEILTTEEDYIKDLQMTIDIYIKPMTEQKLKTKELVDIFSNLEQILPVNQVFFTELKKCRNGAVMQSVGDAFLKVADYFKLYTMYCSNHSKAVIALQKMLKSEQNFKAFIKEIQLRPDYNGLNLESYLLKPVQRICKYPLLLKELLKSTPAESPDRKGLEMAKDKIDAIVKTVNERTKQVEVMLKTMDAIQRIKGGRELHSPTTCFVHEGPVLIRFSGEPDGHSHKYYIFLFNDALAFTKPPKLLAREKFLLQNSIELSSLYISDLQDKDGISNSFVLNDAYASESYLLTFTTAADKSKWIGEFEKQAVTVDANPTDANILSKFPFKNVSSAIITTNISMASPDIVSSDEGALFHCDNRFSTIPIPGSPSSLAEVEDEDAEEEESATAFAAYEQVEEEDEYLVQDFRDGVEDGNV